MPNERWQEDITHWKLASGRRTPAEAYAARPKATPWGPAVPAPFRVRRDRIDISGRITLRHNSRLHHIGLAGGWQATR